VVRRFVPEFVHQHKDAIEAIIHDIGAPIDMKMTGINASFVARSDDTSLLFPSARHKDWYCGHSYASGLFSMSNGKSQESSSESVNAYYALALYASLNRHNNNNDTREDDATYDYYTYTRLLLAMEIRSIQLYWHMSARQEPPIYEPQFAANRMAGVVSEMSVVYSTWFGHEPAQVHGINIMPVTPITTRLFRYDLHHCHAHDSITTEDCFKNVPWTAS
jgi:endoglucanase Acf2